jgi:hypothetical protein
MLDVLIFSQLLLACLKILIQHTAVPLEQKHFITERGCSHPKPGTEIKGLMKRIAAIQWLG